MASSSTGIQWTDRTWNPVRGCSRVSPGCTNCYAEKTAARFAGEGLPYHGLVRKDRNGDAQWTGVVRLIDGALGEPLSWRKPARIFVNSMSDLFHEALSDEEIASVFGVMSLAPWHTFQVLTKRAARMRAWFARLGGGEVAIDRCLGALSERDRFSFRKWSGKAASDALRAMGLDPQRVHWPLPNVHLGVSVEDQRRADERIPHLLAVPAAVRFLSVEPQLGHVSLDRFFGLKSGNAWAECLCDQIDPSDRPCLTCDSRRSLGSASGLHWIIQGGESGPNARAFNLAWARSLRDQCRAAGVAYFFKQAGALPCETCTSCGGDGNLRGDAPPWEAARRRCIECSGAGRSYLDVDDKKGGDLAELPGGAEAWPREFPSAAKGAA